MKLTRLTMHLSTDKVLVLFAGALVIMSYLTVNDLLPDVVQKWTLFVGVYTIYAAPFLIPLMIALRFHPSFIVGFVVGMLVYYLVNN